MIQVTNIFCEHGIITTNECPPYFYYRFLYGNSCFKLSCSYTINIFYTIAKDNHWT